MRPRGPRVGGHLARTGATLGAALCIATAGLEAQTMDDHLYWYVAFDELEYARSFDERPVEYDAQAWIGGDFTRLWFKARGEQSTLEREGGFELEGLYGRTTHPFWDVLGGVRVDRAYGGGEGATRGLLALGIQGLAPYWFEVESFLYLSQNGDVSARLEASYELLFTQRLVLEPEVEVGLAVQDVEDFGVASGLDAVELGARLRYELIREFAPYVGISWVRDRVPGPTPLTASGASFVAGLRLWY